MSSFSRMMSDMSRIPSGPSSRPWTDGDKHQLHLLTWTRSPDLDQECGRAHFDEGDPDGSVLHMSFHLVTQASDELMRDDENDDLCSSDGVTDVWERTLVRSEGGSQSPGPGSGPGP